MPRPKNDAVKLKICILHKQQSSINFSIRLEKNITKEEAIKKTIEFLKQNL